MRFLIFIMITLGFLVPISSANGLPLPGRVEGTYKSIKVAAADECRALCKADDIMCRGVLIYQPDSRKPDAICHLNDGLSSASPFEIKPPKPLSLYEALADLNAYRKMKGLKSVGLSAGLIDASERHAKDLGVNGMSGHTGSDGSTAGERAARSGYEFSLLGENVAAGQKSWDEVFKAWQDSPGHDENLLLPGATEVGFALVYEPKTTYGIYWAMLMGAPLY